jgi:hypothetical protein
MSLVYVQIIVLVNLIFFLIIVCIFVRIILTCLILLRAAIVFIHLHLIQLQVRDLVRLFDCLWRATGNWLKLRLSLIPLLLLGDILHHLLLVLLSFDFLFIDLVHRVPLFFQPMYNLEEFLLA